MTTEDFELKKPNKIKQFSITFVTWVLLIAFTGSVFGIMIIKHVLERNLSVSYAESIHGISEASQLLLSTLAYSALSQILIAIPAIFIATIFYSHRIVGPMFRFMIIFRDITQGKLRNVATSIRKNDLPWSTVRCLAFMKRETLNFIESYIEKSKRIEQLADELEKTGDSDKNRVIQEIRNEAASLADLMGKVKMDEPKLVIDEALQ